MKTRALALSGSLIVGLGIGLAQDGAEGAAQDPLEADLAPRPAAALAWVEAAQERGESVFEVFEGEGEEAKLVARVVLEATVAEREGERFLELMVHLQEELESEAAPERQLTRLALDPDLTPIEVRWWEAGDEQRQLAVVGVGGGKLTGKVHGRSQVRNVPAPVATDAALLLSAATLPFEDDARLALTRLAFDRRGPVVELDEKLVFAGFEERDGVRLAKVEHKSPRGRTRGTLWFDEERRLVERRTEERPKRVWRPYVEPVEDDE